MDSNTINRENVFVTAVATILSCSNHELMTHLRCDPGTLKSAKMPERKRFPALVRMRTFQDKIKKKQHKISYSTGIYHFYKKI